MRSDTVTPIRKGDRVALPFNISCGFCFNCTRGYTNACLTANPEGVGAAYGYAGMGPYRGSQAEFVRVPFADFNCVLPQKKPYFLKSKVFFEAIRHEIFIVGLVLFLKEIQAKSSHFFKIFIICFCELTLS